MFDFRYHVASLAAVFVALVLGILVGVGVSSNDTLSHSERKLLNEQKAELQARYTALAGQLNALQDEERAASAFSSAAYSAVMRDRLKGKRLGIVFVGPSNARLRSLVEGALTDANGVATRYRSLQVPVDPEAIQKAIASRPALAAKYAGPAGLEKLGKELGVELVKGGKAPLWGPLSSLLVVERLGGMRGPLDGVVVARTAPSQHGPTVGFLHGLYAGLGSTARRSSAWRRPTRRSRRCRSSASSWFPPSTTWRRPRAGSRWPRCSPARSPATTASTRRTTLPSCRRCRVAEPLTVLIAARDEEERIGATVAALRQAIPGAEVIVADDGSRDGTAAAAAAAGATVISLRACGKGQALSAAERVAPPGRLLLVDADLVGDPSSLLRSDADLAIAAFARRSGGGFGLAKRAGRALVRLRSGYEPREPLSGQRALSPAARAACFPLAPGFGCEVRMTIDAVRAGLSVEEPELELEHRATCRDLAGFAHRGRQLLDALVATGPLRVNHRGLRLPLVGWLVALDGPAVAAVAAIGLADDLWSGPERGFRAHLRSRRTTGVLKLVGIPAVALAVTRSLSGALLVGLVRERAQPARHASRPRAQGLPDRPRRARRAPTAGRSARRPAAALRSPRDGDAGRCRLERARRRARF